MKIVFISLIMSVCFGTFAQDSVNSRIDEIDERLSNLEYERLLSKFILSGNFMNHFEAYQADNEDTDDASNSNTTTLNPFLMRVAINFDVNINDNMSFFSTIGMSKFWNQSERDPDEVGDGPQYRSMKGGYGLTSSDAYFDTAYIQYKLSEKWKLSLGRMTTNNGPPIEQLDGLERSGTYPRFAYNSIFDGIAFTYKPIDNDKQSLKFRIFYTPFVYVDKNHRDEQVTDGNDRKIESLQPQTALLSEYELKKLSFADSVQLYHMIWNYEHFYEEGFQDDDTYRNEYSAATANLFYLGFKNLFKSGLNLNYSYYMFDERFAGDIEHSYNYFINMNYKFSKGMLDQHTAGFEYINTDEVYYLEDHTALYVADFYTRHSNNGYHLYYAIPLGNNQILRIGHFNYKGGVTDWNEEYVVSEVQSTYVRWRVFF